MQNNTLKTVAHNYRPTFEFLQRMKMTPFCLLFIRIQQNSSIGTLGINKKLVISFSIDIFGKYSIWILLRYGRD